jgi:integrase
MVAGSVAARTWRTCLAVGAARARHGVYDLDRFAVVAYDPLGVNGDGDIFQKATEALSSHRARQGGERLRIGSLWQDNGLVFPTTRGITMSGTNVLGCHFKPLLTRTELPAIRLHDLRHTCATILLMAGKHPKYVQELPGHATIDITLDTYSHVIEAMDGGLGDAMDERL